MSFSSSPLYAFSYVSRLLINICYMCVMRKARYRVLWLLKRWSWSPFSASHGSVGTTGCVLYQLGHGECAAAETPNARAPIWWGAAFGGSGRWCLCGFMEEAHGSRSVEGQQDSDTCGWGGWETVWAKPGGTGRTCAGARRSSLLWGEDPTQRGVLVPWPL